MSGVGSLGAEQCEPLRGEIALLGLRGLGNADPAGLVFAAVVEIKRCF